MTAAIAALMRTCSPGVLGVVQAAAPRYTRRGMEPPLPFRLVEMAAGYWVSQALHVAAKLGLADLIAAAGGEASAAEIAPRAGADASALHRLLRALASRGVFAEDEERPGHFRLTALAELLRADVPLSLRPLVLMLGEEHYRAWGDLLASVRTGEAAFPRVYGMGVFDYYARNEGPAEIFHGAMTALRTAEIAALAAACDFSRFATIVDVGGGHGTALHLILASAPRARGIVFDVPALAEEARRRIEAVGLADRCAFVGGDFFREVPAGGDAYILSRVVHDWDDERATAILRNVRAAIRAEGKLLLFEDVVPPGNGPEPVKLLDLNMLVMTGGRERTEPEYRALLGRAGFRLERVAPGGGLLEAAPA